MEKETKTILSRAAAVAAVLFALWFVGSHFGADDAGAVGGVPDPGPAAPAGGWHRAANRVEVALSSVARTFSLGLNWKFPLIPRLKSSPPWKMFLWK